MTGSGWSDRGEDRITVTIPPSTAGSTVFRMGDQLTEVNAEGHIRIARDTVSAKLVSVRAELQRLAGLQAEEADLARQLNVINEALTALKGDAVKAEPAKARTASGD